MVYSAQCHSGACRYELISRPDMGNNPNIKIILSTIPYETKDTGSPLTIIQQTNALWPALVAQKQAQGRYITLVDNYAATKAANSFADGLHPSTNGDIAIANAW